MSTYYELHKTECKERSHQYYLNNKEHTIARNKQWRQENPEKRRIQKRKDYRNNIDTCMVGAARKRARKLGLPFNLTKEDIIIPELCPYLKIPLVISETGVPTANSPSIDKIIPEQGYVRGNIRIISYKANLMKSNATIEELQTFAQSILELHLSTQ